LYYAIFSGKESSVYAGFMAKTYQNTTEYKRLGM